MYPADSEILYWSIAAALLIPGFLFGFFAEGRPRGFGIVAMLIGVGWLIARLIDYCTR